jgi:adhesin/invasin
MSSRRLYALLALAAAGLVFACDKATPVAPEGTVLLISANPAQIGLSGTSTITVIGRKPDGNPLNPGTEIRLSTDRGTIDPPIALVSNGQATATLRADGRAGVAKVTATTGAGTVTATTDIQIGESDATKPRLTVSVNPNNIPVEGTATVTVIARNADGTAASAGQPVILTTTLGSLNPNRPTTRADGTTTSTLTAGTQAGTAEVAAILGASDRATASVTIRDAATDIAVQANPATVSRGTTTTDVTLSAFVTNSQGQPLQGAAVTFDSDRGVLEDTAVEFTDTTGQASKKLTIRSVDLPAGVVEFEVRASTPGGTGDLLIGRFTISVTG